MAGCSRRTSCTIAGSTISIGIPNSIRSPVIPIVDADDPRIALYRDIRERDLVGRQGHFIAEGEVVLGTLIRSGRHSLLSLLIDARRVDGLSALLDALSSTMPVYAAGQAVLDAIAGFHLHRGILGVGASEALLPADRLLASIEGPGLVVALMGISNHDNLGGIFRNAAAFGANAVLLDAGCCDPFYRKAIRVSVGTTLTLPFAKLGQDDDMIALLSDVGFETMALSPQGGERLSQFVPGPRVAALFGTEGPGLPSSVLARSRTVRIDMAPGIDSLNVATTSGIVLHHLMEARFTSAATPR